MELLEYTLAAHQHEKEKNYWQKKFAQEHVRCVLSSNVTVCDKRVYSELNFDIPQGVSLFLENLSNHSDLRLFIIFLAGINILIHKYTLNKDIILATPVYNPDSSGLQINSILLIRNQIEPEVKFKDFLIQVSNEIKYANQHRNYPVEILLKDLHLEFAPDTPFPLTEIAVLLENIHNLQYVKNYNYDIIFSFLHKAHSLSGKIIYNNNIYQESFIRKLIANYLYFLETMEAGMNVTITDLNPVNSNELHQILYDFNNTSADYDAANETIDTLFEDRAASFTGKTAVIYNNITLTYSALNARAEQFALYLQSRMAGSEKIIAVIIRRSINTMPVILGILKAGHAYLPIDPDLPDIRIAYILKEAGVEIIVTGQDLFTRYSRDYTVINIDKPEEYNSPPGATLVKSSKPGSLAYVIYTSGSSGRPKGVMIEHRSVVNRIHWMSRKYGLTITDTILQQTALSFDVSVCELFRWIPGCGTLCLLEDKKELEFKVLVDTIHANKTTTIDFVPSVLKFFLDYLEENKGELGKLSSLRWLFIGAEEVTKSLVNRFYKLFAGSQVKMINEYGPTEATVDVTWFDCTDSAGYNTIPIGKPIANIRLHCKRTA